MDFFLVKIQVHHEDKYFFAQQDTSEDTRHTYRKTLYILQIVALVNRDVSTSLWIAAKPRENSKCLSSKDLNSGKWAPFSGRTYDFDIAFWEMQ